MSKRVRNGLGSGLLLGLALAFGSVAAREPAPVLKLDFVESEAGIAPYPTRMLVSADFLRVDDGENAGSYILFDRATRQVHSVSADSRTIMTIEPRAVDIEPPFELELSTRKMGSLKDAPPIGARQPKHYRLDANGQECYHVVAVEGLMPEAVAALREFHRVLAADSAATFASRPADLHDACDMAASTFAPTRHLAFGFPIQEWDTKGYTRSLVNYDAAFVPSEAGGAFTLPADYARFTVQALREGRAPPELGR